MIQRITELLSTELIVNTFVYIDIWSFIHLFAGIIIILLLTLIISSGINRLKILLALLILWEIFEFVLYGIINPPLIDPETFVNVMWDLILGIFGGIIIEIYIVIKRFVNPAPVPRSTV